MKYKITKESLKIVKWKRTKGKKKKQAEIKKRNKCSTLIIGCFNSGNKNKFM